jgi:hypothetical protein
MPTILATEEADIRKIEVQNQLGQIVATLYLESSQHKKRLLKSVAQVVEHLPSKCEALSLNQYCQKRKKKRKKKKIQGNQGFPHLVFLEAGDQTSLTESLNLRAMRIPKASEDNN